MIRLVPVLWLALSYSFYWGEVKKPKISTVLRCANEAFAFVSTFLCSRALSWLIALARGRAASYSNFRIPDQERRIRGALQSFNLSEKDKEGNPLPQKGACFRAGNSHQQQRTIDVLAICIRATTFLAPPRGTRLKLSIMENLEVGENMLYMQICPIALNITNSLR